jgi:hypothetical protein
VTDDGDTAVGFYSRVDIDDLDQLRTQVANGLHDQFVGQWRLAWHPRVTLGITSFRGHSGADEPIMGDGH